MLLKDICKYIQVLVPHFDDDKTRRAIIYVDGRKYEYDKDTRLDKLLFVELEKEIIENGIKVCGNCICIYTYNCHKNSN